MPQVAWGQPSEVSQAPPASQMGLVWSVRTPAWPRLWSQGRCRCCLATRGQGCRKWGSLQFMRKECNSKGHSWNEG